jgi:hypothetical protein
MKTVEWSVSPGVQVGPLKFGMSKQQVRDVMSKWTSKFDGYSDGFEPKELKKSKYSNGVSEDWRYFHLHYNASDKLEAIDVWNSKGFSIMCPIFTDKPIDVKLFCIVPASVKGTIDGLLLFSPPTEVSVGQNAIICKAISAGIAFNENGAVDCVTFGMKGYYK